MRYPLVEQLRNGVRYRPVVGVLNGVRHRIVEVVSLLVLALAAVPQAEAVRRVDLIDGGDFTERYEGEDPRRRALVAWWRARGEGPALEVVESGGSHWLVTPPGRTASQPVAAYAPLAEGLSFEGRVQGPGVVTLADGAGGRARFPVGGAGEEFSISGGEIRAALGRAPVPRFELELSSSGPEPARWTGVRALVPLPAPEPEALRAEVAAHIDEIASIWLDRGVDPETGLIVRVHDAVTGEPLYDLPDAGVFPLWDALLKALPLEDQPAWRAPLETFLSTYLEQGFAPTGLPLRWRSGQPSPDGFVEVRADLRLLLDVAERGPERFRALARERARALGMAVLDHGVLPDGLIAASYRPRDGAVTLQTSPLRRLDVPAQLARLGAATGDERFVEAARNALAAFEYTHYWPCEWNGIDPGFDDNLGIYGARAMTMLASRPDDAEFAALLRSGYDYYVPRWRDALRFGGSIAADQVRCWRLLLDYADLRPEVADEVGGLVLQAARAHVKGEQYAGGAWGDVTFSGFDPRTGIEVGDLPGTPANLLEGLALACDPGLPGDPADMRALYTAVLRSIEAHYRRPYGYLLGRREQAGQNPAGGGLRLLPGLVEMLGRL